MWQGISGALAPEGLLRVPEAKTKNDELEMAKGFFGFGRWDAPYWFIGLEQGGGGNEKRSEIFRNLQNDGLCDCKRFHEGIEEFRWHRDGELQRTWKKLMLLLMPVIKRETNSYALLDYQSGQWGSRAPDGQTCLIELGGLAAKHLGGKIDRKAFREERIRGIKERLHSRRPKLAVMYGMTQKSAWNAISGCEFRAHSCATSNETLFAFMPSPTAWGKDSTHDRDWVQFGEYISKKL
jgi:hypothetical protein